MAARWNSSRAPESPSRQTGAGRVWPDSGDAPKIMLFDEVTSALDPELVGEVLRVVRAMSAAKAISCVTISIDMSLACASSLVETDVLRLRGHQSGSVNLYGQVNRARSGFQPSNGCAEPCRPSAMRSSEYALTRASSVKLRFRPLGLGRIQAIVSANFDGCWPHAESGWPSMIEKARFPRKANCA